MDNSSEQAQGQMNEYIEDRTYKVTCQLCDTTHEIDTPLPLESFMHYICDSCASMITVGAILWQCTTCETYGFETGEDAESLIRHLIHRDGRMYLHTMIPVVVAECPVCRAKQVMDRLDAGDPASQEDLAVVEDALWHPVFWSVTVVQQAAGGRFEIQLERKNRDEPDTVRFSSVDRHDVLYRARRYSMGNS